MLETCKTCLIAAQLSSKVEQEDSIVIFYTYVLLTICLAKTLDNNPNNVLDFHLYCMVLTIYYMYMGSICYT